MTDKQIIDSVDVSGCPHLIEDYKWWNIAGQEKHDINRCALSFDNNSDFEEDDLCKENPNCYYKQLKRKEQECEKLKEEVSLLKESNSKLQPIEDVGSLEKCYLRQLDQLKAENKELKLCYKNNLKILRDTETNLTKLVNKYLRLEQILTEIKHIAEDQKDVLESMRIDIAEQILNKISEVLDNDNV